MPTVSLQGGLTPIPLRLSTFDGGLDDPRREEASAIVINLMLENHRESLRRTRGRQR